MSNTKHDLFNQCIPDEDVRTLLCKLCSMYFIATCRANQDSTFTWEGIRNRTKDLITALAAAHGLSVRFDPYNYPDKIAFWDPEVGGHNFRIDGFCEDVIEEG